MANIANNYIRQKLLNRESYFLPLTVDNFKEKHTVSVLARLVAYGLVIIHIYTYSDTQPDYTTPATHACVG